MLIASIFWVDSAKAADDDEPKKPPQQIHLENFEVPLGDTGRQIAFTMFLYVYDQEKLWQVCRDEARLRDAVMTYLYSHPFRVTKDGDIDVKRVQKKLRPRINRALKEKLIKRVKIGKGKIPLQDGPLKKPKVSNPTSCGLIAFRRKGKQ